MLWLSSDNCERDWGQEVGEEGDSGMADVGEKKGEGIDVGIEEDESEVGFGVTVEGE